MVYYLSSAYTTAVQLLVATRQHGQIENGLHWVKDVCFQEDWAIFNTFAITLARRQGWRTVTQTLRA